MPAVTFSCFSFNRGSTFSLAFLFWPPYPWNLLLFSTSLIKFTSLNPLGTHSYLFDLQNHIWVFWMFSNVILPLLKSIHGSGKQPMLQILLTYVCHGVWSLVFLFKANIRNYTKASQTSEKLLKDPWKMAFKQLFCQDYLWLFVFITSLYWNYLPEICGITLIYKIKAKLSNTTCS